MLEETSLGSGPTKRSTALLRQICECVDKSYGACKTKHSDFDYVVVVKDRGVHVERPSAISGRLDMEEGGTAKHPELNLSLEFDALVVERHKWTRMIFENSVDAVICCLMAKQVNNQKDKEEGTLSLEVLRFGVLKESLAPPSAFLVLPVFTRSVLGMTRKLWQKAKTAWKASSTFVLAKKRLAHMFKYLYLANQIVSHGDVVDWTQGNRERCEIMGLDSGVPWTLVEDRFGSAKKELTSGLTRRKLPELPPKPSCILHTCHFLKYYTTEELFREHGIGARTYTQFDTELVHLFAMYETAVLPAPSRLYAEECGRGGLFLLRHLWQPVALSSGRVQSGEGTKTRGKDDGTRIADVEEIPEGRHFCVYAVNGRWVTGSDAGVFPLEESNALFGWSLAPPSDKFLGRYSFTLVVRERDCCPLVSAAFDLAKMAQVTRSQLETYSEQHCWHVTARLRSVSFGHAKMLAKCIPECEQVSGLAFCWGCDKEDGDAGGPSAAIARQAHVFLPAKVGSLYSQLRPRHAHHAAVNRKIMLDILRTGTFTTAYRDAWDRFQGLSQQEFIPELLLHWDHERHGNKALEGGWTHLYIEAKRHYDFCVGVTQRTYDKLVVRSAGRGGPGDPRKHFSRQAKKQPKALSRVLLPMFFANQGQAGTLTARMFFHQMDTCTFLQRVRDILAVKADLSQLC